MLRKYGLSEAVARKRVIPEPGGSAATLVASGAAELGIQQISEMIGVPGVTILELPEEFKRQAAYDAIAVDRRPQGSQIAALLEFLGSQQFQGALARFGLQPVQIALGSRRRPRGIV
ncbi:molybdate ABC transporter substrate-binding protein [Variovorax ginsengisoli]|uniref:Substrate-binding domain-containing protein n=1 Tax=Variovorax ginsengisoli TaxID=363844 RepID=A0ABT8SCC4_9BURK|nr:substrate-binding domain-containing protein [Variovorax ginsengisoli]MDN8617394.1 substrate-binding domain-containing protein [Variovorax ginsengisoli]MDO1536564.1 substrate-binding domain-containing protein [Variovorax ginsengisoli]